MTFPAQTLVMLSWRYLWRNRRRSLIMLGAITIGVWAMIFMTALMRGMVEDMLDSGIRNLPGHIQIQHPDYLDDPSVVNSIAQPDAALRQILNHSGMGLWTTRIRVPAVIASERETRGINLVGVMPQVETELTDIPRQIVAGRYLESAVDRGIVIGDRLARRLHTDLGKRVVLMSQNPDNDIRERGFRIVGIYRAELPALEEVNVYAARDVLQQLLDVEGRVSQVILVDNRNHGVESSYRWLVERLPEGLDIRPWYEIDTYLAAMAAVMDGFVLVWILIIFLALSFGLVNTLAMAVFERVREIGLIQALGMRPSLILWQILIESLLLLLIGLASGNALAIITVKPLEAGLDVSVVAEGMAMMGAGSVLYPSLAWRDVLLADLVVVVLGIATSLLPAWRASRLDPVRSLNTT